MICWGAGKDKGERSAARSRPLANVGVVNVNRCFSNFEGKERWT